MDLGRAFDGVSRVLLDQDTNRLFTASGQSYMLTCSVTDTSKPVRITLAWTDAPGSTFGNAFNNDLNLTVQFPGTITYRGNVFEGVLIIQDAARTIRAGVDALLFSTLIISEMGSGWIRKCKPVRMIFHHRKKYSCRSSRTFIIISRRGFNLV